MSIPRPQYNITIPCHRTKLRIHNADRHTSIRFDYIDNEGSFKQTYETFAHGRTEMDISNWDRQYGTPIHMSASPIVQRNIQTGRYYFPKLVLSNLNIGRDIAVILILDEDNYEYMTPFSG
jgi:hypothetical protein